MRTLAFAFALLIAAGMPVSAHRMKLFATVEDGAVSGYAFFTGGGRPEGATLIVRDGTGLELHRGTTGEGGAFFWRPPQPSDLMLLVDAGDGHIAEAAIRQGRFAAVDSSAAGGTATELAVCSQTPDPTVADLIDRAVDRAVSRQLRPLLETYAAAEARIRFNDVVGGIGMIIGLAGIAMWASARRRDKTKLTASGD